MTNYKIMDVEGIGDIYGRKLINAGVNTVEDLLKKGALPADRKQLEQRTGIPGKLLLAWINQADLMRVNGVGPQFAELLVAAGVDTVKEFRHRVADHLMAKIAEVNERRNLVGRLPALPELQAMIDQAGALDPVLEY